MLWIVMAASAGAAPFGGELADHMQHHFAASTDAVWSVALGDLDGAHMAAKKLDHPRDEAMPEAMDAGVEKMRAAALALVAAPDLETAAKASAALAVTCAECHTATGRGPTVTDKELEVPELFKHHSMAAYFLWVGIVVPNSDAFQAGAKGLLPPPSPDPGSASGQLAAYEALAKRASEAAAADQPDLWTEIIGACATCHQAAGIKLEP